jgi:hypothetical protein
VNALDKSLSEGLPESDIAGWRDRFIEAILGNYDILKNPSAKSGYLSMLYVLRMMTMPRAYSRSRDTERFQEMIAYCIVIIRESKGD